VRSCHHNNNLSECSTESFGCSESHREVPVSTPTNPTNLIITGPIIHILRSICCGVRESYIKSLGIKCLLRWLNHAVHRATQSFFLSGLKLARFKSDDELMNTTLVIPISVCYASELRSIITSYSGVHILLRKVQ